MKACTITFIIVVISLATFALNHSSENESMLLIEEGRKALLTNVLSQKLSENKYPGILNIAAIDLDRIVKIDFMDARYDVTSNIFSSIRYQQKYISEIELKGLPPSRDLEIVNQVGETWLEENLKGKFEYIIHPSPTSNITLTIMSDQPIAELYR